VRCQPPTLLLLLPLLLLGADCAFCGLHLRMQVLQHQHQQAAVGLAALLPAFAFCAQLCWVLLLLLHLCRQVWLSGVRHCCLRLLAMLLTAAVLLVLLCNKYRCVVSTTAGELLRVTCTGRSAGLRLAQRPCQYWAVFVYTVLCVYGIERVLCSIRHTHHSLLLWGF
jgi:hypothetical protein